MFLGALDRPTKTLPPPTPAQTMAWMVKFIQQGQQDVRLRMFAEKLVKSLHAHDYLSEYAAILNWVRVNIRYSRDPRTLEQVKTPQAVLETRTGDCDDLAVLIGTLVGQLGGQVRVVAGAFKAKNGQPVFSHVWAEAFDPANKVWVVLDPVPGRKVNNMVARLKARMAVPAIT